MEKKREGLWLCLILSAAAVLFLVSPAWSQFLHGNSRQYLSQVYLRRDALELAAYFAVMLVAAIFAKEKKGIVILAVSALYLLSTGTLAQCLVSYVYIEILITVGRSALALFRRKGSSAGVCFLSGSIVWGSCAVMMSLLRTGTIEDLRRLTAVLFLLAIANPKFHVSLNDILAVKYVRYLSDGRGAGLLCDLFFLLIMLISCARVNTHLEFDSFWYALYPDKCLFGENSFYDFLGYTEFVFYYPKFKELLLAPISGLGLPGYLISANLWILVLCITEVHGFLQEHIRGNRLQILCVLYLIFSTVCVVGIAGTAKSDTISYLYLLMLVIYFMRYFRTGGQSPFWIALAAGIMSYTVKYTNFLFSTILFFIFAAAMAYRIARHRVKVEKPEPSGLILVVLAVFLLFGILYRTYALTGYPTYREATGVWNWLGLHGKPYFEAAISEKPENVFRPDRILDVLFRVGRAEKISVVWTGNYSVFLGLCMLILYRKRQRNGYKLLGAAALALILPSLYFLVTMAAPDGNYFSAAVIISTCYILIRITDSAYWEAYRKWFTAVVCAFLLLNLAFVFITHPSWQTGTRIWGRPVSLIMTEQEKYETYELELKSLGVYEINERLKETDGRDFILADSSDSRMCMLNARVEVAGGFFQRYLSAADIGGYEDFVDYIDYVGLNGFIVQKDGGGVEEFYDYVMQYIAEHGCVEQIDTEKYSYYRIW